MDESASDRFDEVFEIELDAWIHGLRTYPGERFPGLLHRIVKELGLTFREAVRHGYAFDIVETARRLAGAVDFIVDPKEVAFAILLQLPNPLHLNEAAQPTLAQVINQLEEKYGGALERLQRKWLHDRKVPADNMAEAGAASEQVQERREQEPTIAVRPRPARPTVFFSHCSLDKVAVRQITDILQAEGVLVWLDERELDAAAEVHLPIEQAIRDSQFVLVAASQGAAQSDWVSQELRMTVRLAAGDLPKLYVAARLDDANLPSWLGGISYFDFRPPKPFDDTARAMARWMVESADSIEDLARRQRSPVIDKQTIDVWTLPPERRPPPPNFTSTVGWTREEVELELARTLERSQDWERVEPAARHWWLAFAEENWERPQLVLRLAEELAWRGATIGEYFLAYVYSQTDNLQAVLHYMDYRRVKHSHETRQQRGADAAGAVQPRNTSPNE